VGDRLQQITASAIHLRQRDEGAAQIVPSARTQLEGSEIEAELPLGVGARTLGHVACGDDEVVRSGRSAIRAFPARQLPFGQKSREDRMNRNAPGHHRLCVLEVARTEWLESLIVLPPGEAGRLTMPKRREGLDAVEHPSVFEDPGVAHEALDLLARENGVRAERGILCQPS
jgi:hypothetical protein